MRGSTRILAVGVALLVIAALAAATGCSPGIAPTPVDTSDAISPGIVETSDHIEATGILMHIDDGQGLFYAIAGEQHPALSSLPPLIAVLANPDDIDAEAHGGQTVRVVGVQDPYRAQDRGVPLLQVDSLTVLDSRGGLGQLEVPEPTLRDVGIHALQDGRTQVVGEVTFFDTPDARYWALRRPATDSRQRGVSYLTLVDNPDVVGLQMREGIVAVNGSLVESETAPLGLPVLHADEIASTH